MALDDLLKKWLGKQGGAERANYQMFLTELAQALDLPAPDPKGAGLGDYQFEAPVKSEAALGGKGTGRIDLYKRGCFILEAKQSQVREGETLPDDPPAPPLETEYDLFGNAIGVVAATGKPRPRYDRLMSDARLQAERYALALPAEHRTPPFLIVADIGRSFEIYFDWFGNGRGYGPFPDERSYRVGLAELADAEVRDRLRAIWTDPASIDPRLRAAEVTREIAFRLSRVAEQLEKEASKVGAGRAEAALGIEETSLFLMRTLFCMFAEDVELLPRDSFTTFLGEAKGKSELFWRRGLEDLWQRMNDPQQVNRYWSYGDAIVRYFNGNLFQRAKIFDLPAEFKGELHVAAGKDWRKVEPAIFGTLLEQVLSVTDRAKLGAHYTPRAYVERLVQATMMDVLLPEWEAVQAAARAALDRLSPSPLGEGLGWGTHPQPVGAPQPSKSFGAQTRAPTPNPSPEGEGLQKAIALACAFHARLVHLRVLDPACGTGNFLYVAMEQLLRLESEVRQFVIGLGGALAPGVHPNQFLGLELNPRAAVIAELVLWIGWLRYRLANTPEAIGEPVLPPLTNINGGTHGGFDAVLALTATGEPDTENPRRPEWPEAEFIIGNPPFIGGKDLRERLGGAYAETLWRANPRVPKSADFVMHWWDRAADILTRPGTRLRRFGFVTTNSITQVFSRRVIEGWLALPPPPGEGDHAKHGGGARGESAPDSPRAPPPFAEGANGPPPPVGEDAPDSPRAPPPFGEEANGPPPRSGEDKLHLVLAIADHPWTRVGKDAAAVRIAMTVAAAGPGAGRLVTITSERALDTDEPVLGETEVAGAINADLSVGIDVTRVVPLKANEGLCSPGVKLHGAGFIVTPAKARELGLGTRPGLEKHIRDYRNGRDLLQRPRGVMVIDLFGLSEIEVMERFPEVYQHLLIAVKPERDANRRDSYRRNWWIFGEPRREMRPALSELTHYVATVETSKHRIFFIVDQSVLPDNRNLGFATESGLHFGVLSSRVHGEWVEVMQGTLEDRPIYTKSYCFDPFPFPDPPPEQRAAIVALAERLDATRRVALDENPSLTMTGLYNLVAAIRDGTLGADDEPRAIKARARIVAKLHDDLDAAVAEAYGWEWPLPPQEIVARLVALNAERAAEEAAGHVRWLRPDYQVPRFGKAKGGGGLRPG